MENLRLYEAEVDYTSEKDTHEYPTVSYCKENDTVYYMSNATTFDQWVDLGLPSGLKWAACNLGATKPEEYGLYFAWGETQGYTGITDEKQFSWTDYTLCDGTENNMLKYNATDKLSTLEAGDDAATAVDISWKIPTKEECEELQRNTTLEWVDDYNGTGVAGRLFTSKNNGNSIFAPAAGCCSEGSVYDVGQEGIFWTNQMLLNDKRVASSFNFGYNGVYLWSNSVRCMGFSVRPVRL